MIINMQCSSRPPPQEEQDGCAGVPREALPDQQSQVRPPSLRFADKYLSTEVSINIYKTDYNNNDI